MVADWMINPVYWVIFFLGVLIFTRIMRAFVLSPYFITSLFLAQSAAVLVIEYSRLQLLALNGLCCIFFFLVGFRSRFLVSSDGVRSVARVVDRRFGYAIFAYPLFVCVLFVLGYLFFSGDLSEDFLSSLTQTESERATERKADKLVLLMGLALPSMMALLLGSPFLSRRLKWVAAGIFIVFTTFSGSKAGFSSLILMLFALLHWQGVRLPRKYLIFGIGVLFLGPFVVFLFASERFGVNATDIVDNSSFLFFFLEKILYRVVANNDQVELLILSGASIYDYPFSGPLQLFDPIIKVAGLKFLGFEYSSGEWLYGINFGDWSGVGPNPTFLIEMPQALGFLSCFGMFFLGQMFRLVYVARGSMLLFPIFYFMPTILFDISLFQMKVIAYVLFLVLLFCFGLVFRVFRFLVHVQQETHLASDEGVLVQRIEKGNT